MQNHGRPVPVAALYASRIKHDAEQIRYLAERGLWRQPDSRYQATLADLRQRALRPGEANQRICLSQEEAQALGPSMNRILHYADNPALPQGTLNPELDVDEIEQRYNASHPEIIHIDALLRPEALGALRQFCLESTIWKKDYEDGYVGAFLGEGFSSPFLLQVAEELRTTFPGIFRQHRLLQAWAFKQDSARRPLKIHADAAAVNVNFWITPDDANLDSASGGLIVWDKEAPREWDFKAYNSTAFQPKIREFLKQSGASPVKFPIEQTGPWSLIPISFMNRTSVRSGTTMHPGESTSPSCMAAGVERVTGLSLTVQPAEIERRRHPGKSPAKMASPALHGDSLLVRNNGFLNSKTERMEHFPRDSNGTDTICQHYPLKKSFKQ